MSLVERVAGRTAGLGAVAGAGAYLLGYAVGDGSIAPDAVTAVLLAGAVYPVVFGGIGGVLGGRL